MSGVLPRLEQKEAVELERLTDLRTQLESLRAQVTASEERLARLAIAREEVLTLQREAAAEDSDDLSPAQGERTESGAKTDAGGQRSPRRRLSQVDEQVVVLLAGRGEGMRAREVALAVGEPDKRGRVEVVRSRLKRLVSSGWLTEEEQGLFRVAAKVEVTGGHAHVHGQVNGFAGEGGAPVSR